MPGRNHKAESGYRYGFNGKENDNGEKGDGNQQDYGMRIYDPRLGRFLSVDPISKKYPQLTPYQFASNRPIDGIDLDGLEWALKATIYDGKKVTQINNEFTVKLKVINHTTMTDTELKDHLNLIKFGSEIILKNKYTQRDGSIQTYSTVKIEYDFSDTHGNPDQGFTLEAVNSIAPPMGRPGYITIGQTEKIGNTLNNKITLAVSEEIKVNGVPGKTEVYSNTKSGQAQALAEEIGHTASLGHTGINTFGDRPDETDKDVVKYTGAVDPKTNVMVQRGKSGISSTMNFMQFVKIWKQVIKDAGKLNVQKSDKPLIQ